jgi:hypothetical protein
MKVPGNWIAALGIAMSIPSTIFVIAWLSMKLVEWGYLSKLWGVILFITVIINSFVLLVWNGINKKN